MTPRVILLMVLVVLIPHSRASDDRLTLAFDDAPVERILNALADFQQLNLLIAPGVEGTLSLRLDNVPWQQALSLVARMARLTVVTEENVLLVYPESWQQLQQQKRAQQQAEQQQQQPLKQRTLVLHYADVSEVHHSLQAERLNLMTSRGSATVDTRTNALLLRDTEAALNETERWVQALDVPLEQVELSAHIVTISEDHLRELGVSWHTQSDMSVTEALRHPRLAIPLGVSNSGFSAGLTLARLGGELLDLELSALEQENQVEIIASPHLFTSHQQTATIKQGSEIPYEVASGNHGATTIEFKEAVLGMEVTPSVLANGRIHLKLRISQNVPGRNINSGETEILTIDKQEIETQVTLHDGQTLALGGIFQQQRAKGRNKVPLLGDLPWLGQLFRKDIAERKKRELVIFITPRLVREAAVPGG